MSSVHWAAVVASGSREDVASFAEAARSGSTPFALSSLAPFPPNLDEPQATFWRERNWGCAEISPDDVHGPYDLNLDGSALRWNFFCSGSPWPVFVNASLLHPDLSIDVVIVEPDTGIACARRYHAGAQIKVVELSPEALGEMMDEADLTETYPEADVLEKLVEALSSGPIEQMCSNSSLKPQ
ncbi:hypothetical protein [Bosea sp. RAC05]|uniref:hypothetical protein n=1 Tax=Bosea sp. RAC05 TaxID=1842539 RepID=UPI00083D9E95|nr:hypothetical protein [Bosea sp. RAC05]AOG02937.1 hypothetical protein BSY19_4849 [Bosea sp. RAC05]